MTKRVKGKVAEGKRISLEDCFPQYGRKAEIDLYNLVGYLRQEGFFRVGDDLFMIDECIAKRCSIDDVVNYVYEYMFKVRSKTGVVTMEYAFHRNWFTQSIGRYSSAIYRMLGLGASANNYLRDTADEIYFCFLNGVVVVTKDAVELHPYSEVVGEDKFVLEEKIIKRNIDLLALSDGNVRSRVLRSDFAKFARLAVAGNDTDCEGGRGFKALACAIGYMISGHKDPAHAKMVFFSDVNNGDTIANGRSGKSLCSSVLLRQVRDVAIVDGKQFSGNSQFMMDNVDANTDIVVLQDVKSDFNKEALYNMITNDFEVGKKYKARTIIPFEVSPKIMADSNFGIRIVGSSDEARFVIVGFSHYWNRRHQPMDEFKRRFFTEWDAKEWNYFYHFIFICCQLFLRHGTLDYRRKEIMAYSIYERFDKDLVDDVREILKDPNNFLTKQNSVDLWWDNISYWKDDKYSSFSVKMNTMRELMKYFGYTKHVKSISYRDKETGRVTSRKVHWFERNGDASVFMQNDDKN